MNLQVLALLESVRANVEVDHLKAAIKYAFKGTDLLADKRSAFDLPSFTQTPTETCFAARKSVFDNSHYMDSNSSSQVGDSHVRAISVKKPKPSVTSKIRGFLDAAEDAGHSEKIAVAALAKLGVDAEEDDLLFWCLENAEEADIMALYEEAMSNAYIVKEIRPVSDDSRTRTPDLMQSGKDEEET